VALVDVNNIPTSLNGVTVAYAFQSANEPAFGLIGNIVPCDCDATASPEATAMRPFATLLNGPGEFSGAIGPAGSKKAPVVRALWQGNVDFQGYDASAVFVIGEYVYCGGHAHTNSGLYTDNLRKGSGSPAVGLCTHVPSTSEPWLGVASLL